MCFFKIIVNNFEYKIKIMRSSLHSCKKYANKQHFFIDELQRDNIITAAQALRAQQAIDGWKSHRSHADASVLQVNLDTNEVKIFHFNITSKPKSVVIIKSLSEANLGNKDEIFKVIKINQGLYITSHSLISDVNLTEIPYEELKYDPVKNIYVDIDVSNNSKITEFNNFTKANIEKMAQVIINHIESTEVKKVDISNAADVVNDVAVLKYFQAFEKDTFNKATYQEIGEAMLKIEDEVMQIENGIKSLIDKDEL